MTKKERRPTRAVMGENLRGFRKQAGLTQEGLAQKAGLSRATVAAIELGRYGSVELSSVDALSQALNRPESAFLVREESDPAFLTNFVTSTWGSLLELSDDERHCLARIADSFWAGSQPESKAIYELIELRRRHLSR